MKNLNQIIIIVLVCLVIRVLAGWFMGNHFQPRTWEYETLTVNMLEGKGYVFDYREYGDYRALLAPGYSLLTYLVYRIFGVNHLLMLGVQTVLMTGFGLIIWGLARELFPDSLTPLIAGLLAVMHPGIVYYSSTMLHQLTLYLPLFFGCILLFCLLQRYGKWKYAIALGLVGGLSVLTRATILPVIGLGLLLYVVLDSPTPIKSRFLHALTAFILVIGINLPWAFRNYHVLGRFTFAQTNKWEAFWVGNNPNATGGHQRVDGSLVLHTKPPGMQAEINAAKGDELRIEGIFKKYSVEYIRKQPLDFICGLVYKGSFFWWFFPHTGITYPRSYLIAYKFLYLILAGFTIAGVWLCQKHRWWRREMIFPAILVLGIWAAHTMNFMEMRHRWTVEPVMLIFAALALAHLLRPHRGKQCGSQPPFFAKATKGRLLTN